MNLYDQIEDNCLGPREENQKEVRSALSHISLIRKPENRRRHFKTSFRECAMEAGPEAPGSWRNSKFVQNLPWGFLAFKPTKAWKAQVDELIDILTALPKIQCDMLLWKIDGLLYPNLFMGDYPESVMFAAFGW